jgi:hypothetical protein
MYTGKSTESALGWTAREVAERAGASKQTAVVLSGVVELGADVGTGYMANRAIAIRTPSLNAETPLGLNVRSPQPIPTVISEVNVVVKAEVAEQPVASSTAAANGRTYITYELKNTQGEVVYVGRASGVGTPEQVLQGRLARGHDVFDANPGLRAEVKAVQGSSAANKGAEGVLYEQRLKEGANLLNDPKSPPLSSKPSKATEVRAKIDAYHEDLKQP